jgi:hypothetical protein
VTESTPEEAREKCHKHLVLGLRLIRSQDRVAAVAAALRKSRGEDNHRKPQLCGNDLDRLLSSQPSPVGPHSLLVNAQNLLRDTMTLAAFDDGGGGGGGGLCFRERCHFLRYHTAGFGLVSLASSRQAHQASRDYALRFPTKLCSPQR